VIEDFPRAVTVIAGIGAALNGGFFFAFSTVVMRALGRLPAPQATSAMQSINREAPTPWFMTAFFGTAAVCVVAAVVGIGRWSEPWASYLLLGSALYLACIVLTITYHVPRNNALARVDPSGADALHSWTTYLRAWTHWNHLRTLTCLASATTFVLALRVT
jgi:uncharacterized membrane protein